MADALHIVPVTDDMVIRFMEENPGMPLPLMCEDCGDHGSVGCSGCSWPVAAKPERGWPSPLFW
jgi:hypothetical protein